MPTYEYVCAKCHHGFETVQSIKAAPLTHCPKELCPKKPWGKGKVKRGISTGAGLLFKGSGFYITDYRSDKYKDAAKKDASSTSGSTSGTAKTESKGTGATASTPAPATPKTPPPSKKD